MPRDYYEILGVSKTASADEIRGAHRRLVRKYHPDVNKADSGSTKKFQEVQEAYDALSDPEKRKQYDQFGHAGPQPQGNPYEQAASGYGGPQSNPYGSYSDDIDPSDFQGGQFADIFEQLFNKKGPFKRGRRPRTAADDLEPTGASEVEYPIKLSFEQAARGTTLPISINRGGQIESIDVKIPAGVKAGSRVRIKGRGAMGPHGPGDLYVIVQIHDHPYYRRDGLDVLLDVPISLYEALLGTQVTVPTLDGRVTITIPPGTNSGAKLRIKGAGAYRGTEKGDQLCVIKVIVPKNLDANDIAAVDMIRNKHPIDARSDVHWR
jgi:DnaJ-class molecular chaperone